MRKTITLLIALLALTVSAWAQLPEENHNLALGTHGIGEIVTIPDLEGVVFHNSYEEAPQPESASSLQEWDWYVKVKVTDRGRTDNNYYWQYELAGIWCMNNGEDVIHLTRYEFDEWGNPIKQHNYTITITVAGGMVEVGTWEPGCSTETPDATVLKDTTIHYGESYYDENYQWHEAPIENFVGFRYVSSCYESNGEMVKSWFCVSAEDITVTSSNPEVVTVEWNSMGYYHEIKGLKRGTATITVSAPAVIDSYNSEPRHVAKSVQYNVTVVGDAGPNIGFYDNYDPLTEITLAGSYETPYNWPVIRVDGYDLLTGNFTVTSSNTDVATIDDPTSNEVQFTFAGYGTTIITATVPATETTEEATASFTLTYEDPNATDMYFTDYEGNIIDHMDVGTDEYGNPVYPYNNPGNYYTGVRLVIRKHSTGDDMTWADVTIEPEDLTKVQINAASRDAEGWYTQFECLALGETDIVATFAGDNWDEQGGYYTYSPATARLHINYVNTYRKEATIHFAYDWEEGTSFSQTDGDCGHRGGYSIPAFQVWMKDETTGNTVYYEDPLPLTVTVSDESIAEVTYDENTHFITYFPKAYGTATVAAVFDGDDTYGASAATFTFSFNKNTTPMAECALVDKNGNPVTSIVATEGDLIDAPYLARVDGEDLCYTYLAMATTTNRSRWRLKPETGHWDYFYPKQVGLDTIVFTYYRESSFDNRATEHYEYWDQAVEVRVPVVIMPYITPMISDAETVMNLNPEGNASMSFGKTENDTYNSAEGQLEIKSVVTAANLKLALDSMARGTKDWNDLLPGATTFNVNPGKGKIKIECKTVAGYELKVLVANQGTATISQVDMDVAEISYNVNQVTTVLVYLAVTGGSPAPQRRAPQAKLDEPNAIIKSIMVSPQFDIEAKEDPDNAGLYYSTFFNSTQKYALPNDGTKAFVAKIDGTDMIMTEIANGSQVIPANTAVILQSPTGSFSLTPSDGSAVTFDSDKNQLQGFDEATTAPANCYVLSGHSTDNSVTGVGFYQFSGTIPAHKAYITVSGSAPAPKRLRFVFNEEQTTTGVENVQGDKVQCTKVIRDGQLYLMYKDTMYNVQGQIVK